MPFVSNLDTPLLRLSPNDDFTLRDACVGVHVFGGIGSGKTSGTGKALSGAYLRAGFGGVVTACKPSEVERWLRYAKEHGREKSVILFDENEGFNFLAYELARQGVDGIGTVTECLMRILEAAKRASATASHHGSEPFWEDATRSVLRYTLPPLYAATGSLSIPDIIRFVNTAPTSMQEVTNPAWQGRSFMYSVMDAATRHPRVALSRRTLTDCLNYWAESYPAIPEKTRGNIVITVTTVLDRFKHGRLNRAFCGRTTLVPEMTFAGAVIVLAMPTLTWNEDGVIAQQLFKFMWQRAVLSRNSLAPQHRERPVFLWSDEAQETVHSYDGEFLGLARDSKCCPVYLTQSLPVYYAKIGGDNPRDDAHSLVGKFTTHVYHSNPCPETNEFASRMVGKALTRRANASAGNSRSFNEGMSAGENENSGSSSSYGWSSGQGYSLSSNSGSTSGEGNNWGSNRGRGYTDNVSHGYSESMEFVIEPGEFARILKTGGAANGNIVRDPVSGWTDISGVGRKHDAEELCAMRPPTSMTRFLGTTRIANTLCLGCLATVVAWYAGEIPWWLALGALFFIPTVRKAAQDVRRYDQWFATWQGMGNASGEVAPKRAEHRHGGFPRWVNVTLAVLSLAVILVFVTSTATNEAVRRNLTLFLVGFAIYLLCKTIVAIRRRRLLRVAGTASAGGSKPAATEEVVRWTLPRAASSPSRTDAMRNVPDYCARLMAGH